MKMYKYNGEEDFYVHNILFAEPGAPISIEGNNIVNLVTKASLDTTDPSIISSLLDKLIRTEVNKDSGGSTNDNVNHPSHYTSHPSGVECIEITRHYCFSIGNAIKYLWRAGLKKDASLDDKQKEVEDLNKAIWYIKDRIKQLLGE